MDKKEFDLLCDSAKFKKTKNENYCFFYLDEYEGDNEEEKLGLYCP